MSEALLESARSAVSALVGGALELRSVLFGAWGVGLGGLNSLLKPSHWEPLVQELMVVL